MSIDEMACRLIGREQPLLAALKLAREIKAAVRREAGATLRCSIGLAPNRYLAKVASDMEKPDGLVALTPDLLPAALATLEAARPARHWSPHGEASRRAGDFDDCGNCWRSTGGNGCRLFGAG